GRLERAAAEEECGRAARLLRAGAASQVEFRAAQLKVDLALAQIDQARAALERAREEVTYLEGLGQKLVVRCPVAGVVVTPHLRERRGQFCKEGDLICVVEDPSELAAEIKLPEQDLEHVRPGQRIELKARALPFETFAG